MTSRKLTTMCHRFMRLMSMDEWIPNTTIRFARKSDKAEIGDAMGYSGWCADRKQVWIYVASPKILQADDPTKPVEQIAAETVIHELLHARLEGHKQEARSHETAYELALNCLSRALWKAWQAHG